MVTMETAVAAILTFVLGMAFGIWLLVQCIFQALRTKQGREVYRNVLEKAERHAEHHAGVA